MKALPFILIYGTSPAVGIAILFRWFTRYGSRHAKRQPAGNRSPALSTSYPASRENQQPGSMLR
jgi:hypothetical protein